MTRRTILSRLHRGLLARRQDLDNKRAFELAYLNDSGAADTVGDSADLAFEGAGDEMSSRLAELDDRDISQIDQALARWKQGTYGLCGSCRKEISVTRLNAVPHTPFCINCERDMEKRLGPGRRIKDNWGQISDGQVSMQDERINLSEAEMGMSGSRRS